MKARMPEISYIVSLYNRPDYLAVCLYALRGQAHRDFEVIVTDNSNNPELVRQHKLIVKGMNDPRFRYVQTYGKIEVPDCYWSSEYGVKMAKGKWLCFPCEDCYYPPEWASRMLAEGVAHNLDLVLCENIVVGPDTNGMDGYRSIRVGTKDFPAYKPSFLVLRDRFKGWLNKPTIPAVSGTDRSTVREMVYGGYAGEMRWRAVRDLYYVHN